jgi:hypothetical protein
MALVSGLTVPRAWQPKQDFEGARDWVAENASPADAVVTVDITDYVYGDYLQAGWLEIADAGELAMVETMHSRTFVVYIFPTRIEAVMPAIWKRLDSGYRTAAEFPGTLGGGAVYVAVKE